MNKIINCLFMPALLLFALATAATPVTVEQHGSIQSATGKIKLLQSQPQGYQSHVWFHSISLYLSGDINANGYYHRLEVEFDADTELNYQPVFAEFSLLPSYGSERVFYTSSVFELYRDSANDWLAIDTILDQRFAPDQYLLTVRLFDANTGYLLAEISGFDDSSLDFLALEDYDRDSYIDTTTTVEVSAGSTGIMALLTLCCLIIRRRQYQPL